MDAVKNQLVNDVAALKQQLAALEARLEGVASQSHAHEAPTKLFAKREKK